MQAEQHVFSKFTRRTLTVIGLVVAVALLLLLFWQIVDVLLLAFAGVMVAVALASTSRWVNNHTPLPYGLALVIIVLLSLALLGGMVWWMAPAIAGQGQVLVDSIDMSTEQVRAFVNQRLPWSWETLRSQMPGAGSLLQRGPSVVSRVTGVFSTALNGLTNLLIILFVGIYLAINPKAYINGTVRLMPKHRRERAREIMYAMGYSLRWFLIARGASVLIVGGLSIAGLWLLGIPLALVLGVLTGLLSFVPIVGVIASYVPPVLVALTISPQQALYVFLLYVGIQFVESYFLTPVIQKRAVDLPPVLTILAQVAFGVIFGVLGVLLASPIAAVVLVAVQMIYVEDVLQDRQIEVRAEEQTEANADHESQVRGDE